MVAGETVTIVGRAPHRFTVPTTAKPGEQLWQNLEDAWIDFSVGSLAETKLSATAEKVMLRLTPHVPQPSVAQLTLDGQTREARLVPEQEQVVEFPLHPAHAGNVRAGPAADRRRRVPAGRNMAAHGQALAPGHRADAGELSDRPVFPREAGDRSGGRFRGAGDIQTACPAARSCGPECSCTRPTTAALATRFVLYEPIALPAAPLAVFRCDIGKRDGSDRGDGILFRVAVVDSAGHETVVAERQWAEHAWTSLRADLSRWAGQSCRLKLISDVGPANNSAGDWACWANLRLESREPVMRVTLRK